MESAVSLLYGDTDWLPTGWSETCLGMVILDVGYIYGKLIGSVGALSRGPVSEM